MNFQAGNVARQRCDLATFQSSTSVTFQEDRDILELEYPDNPDLINYRHEVSSTPLLTSPKHAASAVLFEPILNPSLSCLTITTKFALNSG
jgi:hypothetical protein